jgi:hypothetical protein
MAEQYAGARAPGLAAPERAEPAAAGLTAGHTDETRELGSGAGFRGQGTADGADCPGTAPGEQDDKRFATLRARLALAGWALSRIDAGDGLPVFLAVRWNMPRELADLAAVERFADLVGAPA